MNVQICDMIDRDLSFVCFRSLKQPIHFLGIIFALVAFICVLEFFVIPSQDHLSTNLRFLVSGACLLTWASTLSRSFAFYFICSHLYGLFMASFLLFYQVQYLFSCFNCAFWLEFVLIIDFFIVCTQVKNFCVSFIVSLII